MLKIFGVSVKIIQILPFIERVFTLTLDCIERGNGPTYFDCSGTVLYGMREVTGINLGDYNAHGIYTKFSRDQSSNGRGMLKFYDYENDGVMNHVTTILDTKYMMHPSSGAGVLEVRPINYLVNYSINVREGSIHYREINWDTIYKR